MDDEFSDLFLLNDCLISGRMSPGPPDAPDDFMGQGPIYDGILLPNGGHNGEVPANFLCFDGDPDLGYPPSGSPRRLSLGPSTAPFVRPMDRVNANGASSNLFAFVKTEDPSQLSPTGKSPDHDYIHDIKMEPVPTEIGGGGSICSSKRASSMEYCHGSSGEGNNDNGIPVKYDVDEYYSDSAETKAVRAGGDTTRIVSTSHTAIASSTPGIGGLLFTNIASSGVITAATEASLISTNEAEGPNLTTKSEAPDGDPWPCGPVLPREDDTVPSGDDNSSTSSGDSCSNCGYLSSGSPTPNHKHGGVHVGYSSHHQGNGVHRFRSSNSSAAAALNLNLRTRSKMHELALKHNLISEQDPRSSKGYVLLSTEERRTLIQEGLPVPTKLPLSKQEEEALKIVRRKIKNKLSAQESRRKRKEYMETLEQQIEGYQSENSSLRRRIDALEKSNQSLLGQLKKLQQQFSPSGSPTTATALIVTNSHGSTFDGTTTSRGSSNVHHTVSLAVVFMLFAIMIPAMPVWPTIFRNAFIASPMMAKSADVDAVSSTPNGYFDHSSSLMQYASSRVLSSGGGIGDCEIPYSAEYFEKLNECRQEDLADGIDAGKRKETLFYSAVVNYTEKSDRISDDHAGLLAADEKQVSAMAVCETLACREALIARKTVANA